MKALYVGARCNDGRPIRESARYKEAVRLGIPITMKRNVANGAESKKEPDQMLVDKYKPTKVAHIIGHKKEAQQIREWLAAWTPQMEKKAILISGPPGIGKTTTAHLIAKETGYTVVEYNASDVRSISKLKGIFALGMRRLAKEVIILDEVDGACERGGIGEIANIIRSTLSPILCIANDIGGPKLKPILSVAHVIKFSRPVKSTIAAALERITVAENIQVTKDELEKMCERNGNDIRAILNQLEFFQEDAADKEKDAIHRSDPFSATGRLLGNRRISLDAAADLVYVDYSLVPLMVQEAYVAANATGSIDETAAAAEFLSDGDLLNKRVWSTQDWSMLPHVVQSTVAAARSVKGPAPWQIFPQMLGKNSTRAKKQRLLGSVAKKMGCNSATMRLDYAHPLCQVIYAPLRGDNVSAPQIQGAIQKLDSMGLEKDDLTETIESVQLYELRPLVGTKTKTAFTNQWKKTHGGAPKRKAKTALPMDDSDEELEEIDEVENDMAALLLDD
jgi:replication factor C subunit 1